MAHSDKISISLMFVSQFTIITAKLCIQLQQANSKIFFINHKF